MVFFNCAALPFGIAYQNVRAPKWMQLIENESVFEVPSEGSAPFSEVEIRRIDSREALSSVFQTTRRR